MNPGGPPKFDEIADASVKRAFHGRGPECVMWLLPGTKLYKWSSSIMGKQGVSPWWLFLEARILPNGLRCDGWKEKQEYARRLSVHERDYHRVRAGVTKQWNVMRDLIAIRLEKPAWAYVGKAAGQLQDDTVPNVYLIAGDYQLWIPGLQPLDITQISLAREISEATSRQPWFEWDFCRELECLDSEPDVVVGDRLTAQWLQQFKLNASKMLRMRSVLLEEHSAWLAASMSDDEVIGQIAELLVSRHLHIHARPEDVIESRITPPGPGTVIPFPRSERRRPEPAESVPVSEAPTFSDVDGAAQAAALSSAAASGSPFCPE